MPADHWVETAGLGARWPWQLVAEEACRQEAPLVQVCEALAGAKGQGSLQGGLEGEGLEVGPLGSAECGK